MTGKWQTFIKRILCGIMLAVLVLMFLPVASVYAEGTQIPAVQTVDVGIPVEEYPELFIPRSMPTRGEGKVAVFLIDFPDYPNENPVATREYYEGLYFTGGIDQYWGSSVAQFYRDQSFGKLNLSGQVFDWYTAKYERSYYDDRKGELIMEAAEFYRAQGVDFSQFDSNDDGVIDAITFHFAGEYSEDRTSPWYPGLCMSLDTGVGQIDGLKFTTLVQVREAAVATGDNNLISTVCHELMHTLGMPDLYTEAYHGPSPVNDIMNDNIPTINPYTKILLGWMEQVQVITGNVDDFKLEIYKNDNPGDVAIVTEEFKGFFGEFFVVAYECIHYLAYSSGYEVPLVWRVDSRLTEDGTAFRYQNLRYNPRPDQKNAHGTEDLSDYLFLEQLSGDPAYDHVLNLQGSIEMRAFTQASVLGPDSIPSSDTHDGVYTGIRLSDFREYNKKYITFDVSFVEDQNAPVVTTQSGELEFKEIVRIHFNENVYQSDAWEQIRITDLNGKPLEATVILPHYPRHQLEISFKDDSYENGYKILLPENCLRDSSGHPLAATELTALPERNLFPIRTEKLPEAGYIRNNVELYIFPQEEGILAITSLWETVNGENKYNMKLEVMRLDGDGNVVYQHIVDYPIPGEALMQVIETGDGYYIAFVVGRTYYDRMFCIDSHGNLMWKHEAFVGTDNGFDRDQITSWENGVEVSVVIKGEYAYRARIHSETGEIEKMSSAVIGKYTLPNGDLLIWDDIVRIDDSVYRSIKRIDAETGDVLAEFKLMFSVDGDWNVRQTHANQDGTILLYCEQTTGDTKVLLLDAKLNLIKSLELTNSFRSVRLQFQWIADDGFYELVDTEQTTHHNVGFLIRRYDRYLNLIWKKEFQGNYIFFFKNKADDLMAYTSVFEPERECYIEYYGSEDAYKMPHTHTLVHTKEKPATCQAAGMKEYWQCSGCGVFYSDEGRTVIADMQTWILNQLDHVEVVVPGYEPQCANPGKTNGVNCAVCGKILVQQQWLKKLGHQTVVSAAVPAGCVTDGLTEGKHCDRCDEIFVAQKVVPATGHSYGEWSVTKAATVETEGEETRTCVTCGETETRAIAKLPAPAEPAPKGNSTVIIIAAAAVVGVAAVCFFLFKKKK